MNLFFKPLIKDIKVEINNWLLDSQVIEPMEKDQGMYSIVITNSENSHKRTLDLSGDGLYLLFSLSFMSFTLFSFIDNTVTNRGGSNMVTFLVSNTHPHWLGNRLWNVWLQWIPLGKRFHAENVSTYPKEPLKIQAFLPPCSVCSKQLQMPVHCFRVALFHHEAVHLYFHHNNWHLLKRSTVVVYGGILKPGLSVFIFKGRFLVECHMKETISAAKQHLWILWCLLQCMRRPSLNSRNSSKSQPRCFFTLQELSHDTLHVEVGFQCML